MTGGVTDLSDMTPSPFSLIPSICSIITYPPFFFHGDNVIEFLLMLLDICTLGTVYSRLAGMSSSWIDVY